MQPIQESPNMSTPTPFKGDKVFVGLDVLLYIISAAWSYMLMPGRVAEGIEKLKGTPQEGKVTPEQMQMYMMVFTGGCMCFLIVIYLFLWINMFKGKKWAFITMLVLTIIFTLMGIMGLSGVGMGLALMGLITGVIKIGYMVVRLIGKAGPALA